MKNPFRKILLALATVLPVLIFVACTSDRPVDAIGPDGFIYSEEEYESLVKAGLVDENGNIIDTSSTSKNKSSSSETANSSSSGTSSSVTDSTKVSSSSQGEGNSSSEPASSSSSEEEDDEEESSSSVAESSSSYSATFGEKNSIVAKEGVLSIGVDAFADAGDDYAEDLEQVKASIDDSEKNAPDGYNDFGVESTTDSFNYDAYIEYKFFCLDKDGNWFEISRKKLAEFIPHFNNGADWGPLEGFKVSFADACKAVYTRKDE